MFESAGPDAVGEPLPAPGGPRDDALLAEIAWCEGEIARLQARKVRAVAAFAACRPPTGRGNDRAEPRAGFEAVPAVSQFAGDEVAAVLGISPGSGRNLVHLALDLVHRLPATLAQLGAGSVDVIRARMVAEETLGLDDRTCAQVDAEVAGRAPSLTPARLRQAVRRAALRLDPRDGAERRREAALGRMVTRVELPDAMAELRLVAPADQVAAVWARVQRAARTTGTPDDDRGIDARRSDALVSLVLGQGRDASSPRVEVGLLVPLGTVLGSRDLPGELLGHGPIDAALAREIAMRPGSVWRRILTDPVSGTVLDVGTTTYRPPDRIDRHVRYRDGTCRFPGCNRSAESADVDHVVAFPEGPTAVHNLAVLCRHHHRLKHETAWESAMGPDGIRWTSPTGRVYYVGAHRPAA